MIAIALLPAEAAHRCMQKSSAQQRATVNREAEPV
ncbi:hypothetical protein K788_00025875 (plasmid) [Paraburkholderia caribensis MBA4]|uniref:Uncharacterized protein n=1 Tax=Paraburkholderia caribensis MBA4 TaxID=1323664 RepID=A0A0P0RKT9_9BURK|nr:hypothetical protein K788_00025875 [Paraburkholderia caribensis MBA4]